MLGSLISREIDRCVRNLQIEMNELMNDKCVSFVA